MSCHHNNYQKWLYRFFVDPCSLNPRQGRALMAHMLTCPGLAEEYRKLVSADHAVASSLGTTTDTSPLELSLGWNVVTPLDAYNSGEGWLQRLWKPALVGFFLSALFTLPFLLRLGILNDNKNPAFQARGTAIGGSPAVRFYCKDEKNEFFRPEQDGIGRCSLDERLFFSYRNPDPQYHYLTLVGFSQAGTPTWYFPNPLSHESVSIQTTSDSTPVGWPVRLSINHKPGLYRIVALFTEHPVSFGELEKLTAQVETLLRESLGKFGKTSRYTLWLEIEESE